MKENLTELSKRFLEALKELGVTGYRLSKEIPEITQSALTHIRKGRNEPSKKVIDLFLSKYPELNPAWLLTGEGEMLRGSVSEPQANYGKSDKVIRYWTDVDVTGGKIELFDDTHTNGYTGMVIPDFSDCTDAVNLYGDSMSPRYNPGQIVILKEWNESFIAYGQVYLLITKNGYRAVKYLKKSDNDNEVLCVSENPGYEPFAINKEDIIKLYLVKGAIEKATL